MASKQVQVGMLTARDSADDGRRVQHPGSILLRLQEEAK